MTANAARTEAMGAGELRAAVSALTYPANQDYDPVSLEPQGVTRKRVELMERNMPELLAGGGSLLDVGSSKGFVSLHLRDRYARIDGYELGRDAWAAAEAVRAHHGFEHIRFVNEPFRMIELSKFPGCATYDVVYAGSVHHHLVKDALLHGAPMFLPLKKLAALARRLLILDGPVSFEGDYSLNAWAKQYGWGQDVRAAYTLEAHVEALAPQFRLVRGPSENERGRQTLVFERARPDMDHLTLNQAETRQAKHNGEALKANMARPAHSVTRHGELCYKFDPGLQSDGVLMLLNSLPEWFAHTRAVLVDTDGNRIGTVTEWVDGELIESLGVLAPHWLRLNDMLTCIGLVEPHLKLLDYVMQAGHCIDVDVDMVNHVRTLPMGCPYLAKWQEAAAMGLGEVWAKKVADNFADEWIFRRALEALGWSTPTTR